MLARLRPRAACAAAGLILLCPSWSAARAAWTAHRFPAERPDRTAAVVDRARHPPHVDEVLDVPFVEQALELCGGAAAAMVMRYWGAAGVYAHDFATYVRREEGGIRAGELAGAIRARGWRAIAFRADAEEFRRQLERGRPVISLIEVGPTRYHYVVIVGRIGDRFVFHDPALAPHRVLTADQLERASRAAGGWALLVLPGSTDEERATAHERGRGVPVGAGDPADLPVRSDEDRCAELVERGVRAARSGDDAGADRLLAHAALWCPDSPAVARELAGLRFRQGRWTDAMRELERGLARDPGDAHAWRLLGASRFMAGDRLGALRAWNRLGEPRIDLVEVRGLGRTRHAVATRLAGLDAGDPLTVGRLELAERRLRGLPAAATARVRYIPQPDGSVRVRATVVERTGPLRGWADLPALAVHGAVERRLAIGWASPTGGGERVTLEWRWWPGRPRVAVGLAAPVAVPTGVVHVGGSWERESYRVPEMDAPPAASGREGSIEREERKRAGVSAGGWATRRLRWQVGLSLDNWRELGPHTGLQAGLEIRGADDLIALRASGGAWARPGGGSEFTAIRVELRGRTGIEPSGIVAIGRAGLALTAAGAPRMLWPGAGTGRSRDVLLRAHPLLEDGAIAGAAFGRRLDWGGVEVRAWAPTLAPLPVGIAGFVDLAKARHGTPGPSGRLHIDMGVGLRVSIPGGSDALRLDYARGLRDGRGAFSLAWEAAGLPGLTW